MITLNDVLLFCIRCCDKFVFESSLNVNEITSKGASYLLTRFKECNSTLTYLTLSSNLLDDNCMKQVGEYIQESEYLFGLSIGNNVTDEGIEILSQHLIGNTTLKELWLSLNAGITDISSPYLFEIAKRSSISKLNLHGTSISFEKKRDIENAFTTPIEQRELPIKSNTKSAAKVT